MLATYIMSEFKYACPVCAQHIRCDSSQAGSKMTCPTCFQEIIIPQAPASEDQRFILTGIKASDRSGPKPADSLPSAPASQGGFPGRYVVLLILAGIGLATGFVYKGTLLRGFLAGGTQQPPAASTLPAPPFGDTNSYWQMDLANESIPDFSARGRIFGFSFQVDRAFYSHGTLILRKGRKGPFTSGVAIDFKGSPPEALAGKSLNILADTNLSARVSLRWFDATNHYQNTFMSQYALRLEFGSVEQHHLPGHIYLCTPDTNKSYVLGVFNAQITGTHPQSE